MTTHDEIFVLQRLEQQIDGGLSDRHQGNTGSFTDDLGEMLAELMRVKYTVAIAGSHGKTTTRSLVATVLRAAGLDPTVVVGGKVNALGSNARLGAGDLFVAEADESDGSFLRLTPTIGVITNIDAEHLDHYGSHAGVKDAFVEFANKIPFYGLAIMCMDHPHVQEIVPRVGRRVMTYGVSRQADFRARHEQYLGFSTRFEATKRGEPLGEFTVRMPDAHNVLNALSVIAVADELEVPLDVVKEAIAWFHGVQRRFTVVSQPTITRGGKTGDVHLIDDYGHQRFRCAEAGAPVVNMVSAYGGVRWESGMSRMFQYEKAQSRLGVTLWDDPSLYHKNSPVYHMHKVTTPVLIMHNDHDGAVPWEQGIEYYMALRRLGKEAWLLNYNGEPHWPVKWQNRLDFNIRMQQFFDFYLRQAPMPAWMKTGNTPLDKGILRMYDR